jgi:hypothetical protein
MPSVHVRRPMFMLASSLASGSPGVSQPGIAVKTRQASGPATQLASLHLKAAAQPCWSSSSVAPSISLIVAACRRGGQQQQMIPKSELVGATGKRQSASCITPSVHVVDRQQG